MGAAFRQLTQSLGAIGGRRQDDVVPGAFDIDEQLALFSLAYGKIIATRPQVSQEDLPLFLGNVQEQMSQCRELTLAFHFVFR